MLAALLVLVIAIALIGALIGWVLGGYFGRLNTQLYAETFHFPLLIYRPSPQAFLIAGSVSLLVLEARGPRGPLDPLPRREPDLPLDTDRSDRCGMRDWVLDAGTSAAELFSGSALDLTPESAEWTVARNEIDEDDLTYHYDGSASLALAGVAAGRFRDSPPGSGLALLRH